MMAVDISEVINTQWELQSPCIYVNCTVGIPAEAFSKLLKCLIKEHLHHTLLYYEELKHFY